MSNTMSMYSAAKTEKGRARESERDVPPIHRLPKSVIYVVIILRPLICDEEGIESLDSR